MDTVMIAPSRGQEVEVLAKAKRRRFTLEYKRRILREADRCRQPGELGALLRREGLYSSHLSVWRAARERGELGGRGTRRREPEPQPRDASARRIAELERESRRLRKRALHETQAKVGELRLADARGSPAGDWGVHRGVQP